MLKKMGFAGVYCCLAQNPRHLGELADTMTKVFGGSKDFASVIFEVSCDSGLKKNTYGGVYGDEATVREQGLVAHYHAGKDNRWLVPEGLVNLDAVWITSSSFARITSTDQMSLGWR